MMKTTNYFRKINRIILYTVCLMAFLSGCHIYKPYERTDVNVAGLYRDPLSETDTLQSDTVNLGNLNWREIFRDPYLQALIEKGVHNNIDLQIARLRIEEAQATLLSSRLAYLPSLGLSPEGTISSFDGNKAIKTYQLPVASSWQIDIFGSLLNASRGARASLLQSESYRQAVQSELIANIANAYYTLLMLDEQLAISEETAVIWRDNVRAMQAMKETGMTNEAAVVQSRANSLEVEASLFDLQQQIRETENALSILLAEPPHTIPRGSIFEQDLPDYLPAGVPVQLLSNRPDVKVAELQLAVAYYTTNQARSAFYPQLTISGSAGWTNNAGTTVINPGKIILSAAASLTQPLFNRGTNIARLRIAKAQQEEAALNFQLALLNAGREVSNALHQYEAASEKIIRRQEQVDNLGKAVSYTKQLFQSGAATYLEILTAQQSLLSAQLNEISDTFQSMQAVVNLYEALGGGRFNGQWTMDN